MSSKNLSKIIVILGPTAAGKTKLAVKLARKFNGEIVSADSRQVYKGMDIGTGKDLDDYLLPVLLSQFSFLSSPRRRGSRKIKDWIPDQVGHDNKKIKISYHLIDIINPNQKFNVSKYKKF